MPTTCRLRPSRIPTSTTVTGIIESSARQIAGQRPLRCPAAGVYAASLRCSTSGFLPSSATAPCVALPRASLPSSATAPCVALPRASLPSSATAPCVALPRASLPSSVGALVLRLGGVALQAPTEDAHFLRGLLIAAPFGDGCAALVKIGRAHV